MGELSERELAATLIAAIAIAGPAVGLVSMVFPQPPGTDTAAAVATFGFSIAIGLLVLWRRAALGWAAIALVAAIGAAVITAVMLTVPERTAAYSSYYVWIGIFAFYFLRPSWALGLVAWIAALYAVAVAADEPAAAVELWLNGVATTLGVGLLILALRSRISGLVSKLQSAALTDELTGLANRRAFNAQLAREIERSDRGGEPLALALLDLDGFKRLNDRSGHLEGDEALRSTADLIAETLRLTDFPARIGGDEFAILLPGADAGAAGLVADRVREQIGRGDGRSVAELTVSIGLGVTGSEEPGDPRALFAAADRALYAAKSAGGDRVAGPASSVGG